MSNIKLTNNVKIDGNSIQAIDLLWTNASGNSDFAKQSIRLSNSTSYKYAIVLWKLGKDLSNYNSVIYERNGGASRMIFPFGENSISYLYRICSFDNNGFNVSSDTGVVTLTGGATLDNGFLIPQKIYGIKLS